MPRRVRTLGLHLAEGIRTLSIVGVRQGSGGALLVRLEGVADRDAAQALAGTEVSVPVNELPALGEGEFYLHELIGARGVSPEGELLGTVHHIENVAGRDLLVLTTPQGPRMVPLIDDTVAAWDRGAGQVTLRVLPGLLD